MDIFNILKKKEQAEVWQYFSSISRVFSQRRPRLSVFPRAGTRIMVLITVKYCRFQLNAEKKIVIFLNTLELE